MLWGKRSPVEVSFLRKGGSHGQFRFLQSGIGGKSLLQFVAVAREVGRRKDAVFGMQAAELR